MANCTLVPNKSKFEKKNASCCEQHDIDYIEQKITRWEADVKLYRCVRKYNLFIAAGAFVIVRLGGWIFWYRRKLKKLLKSKSNQRRK